MLLESVGMIPKYSLECYMEKELSNKTQDLKLLYYYEYYINRLLTIGIKFDKKYMKHSSANII